MSRDWTREEFGITDNTPVIDVDGLEKKCERLQKQLDIAVKRLEFLKTKTSSPYYGNDTYLKTIYQMCDKTLRQIEELNR